MRSSRKQEHCFRTILLTITTSACISIVLFICLQFTGREKDMKAEISNENLFQSEKLLDEKCIPVCDSRNCIKQADILLRTISPSNNPCENFHKFLCGSYEQKAGRYESKSMMLDMTAAMMNKLRDIIENIEAEPETAAAKMKIMYDSCISSGSSELQGIEAFQKVLNSVDIYNWPYLATDFTFSDNSLPKLLATFKAQGDITFLAFDLQSRNEEDIKSNFTFVKVLFREGTFNDTERLVRRDAATDILKYFDLESEAIEALMNDYDTVRNDLINFGEEFQLYDDECEENCSDIHIDCSSLENDAWADLCETVETYLDTTKLKQHISTNEIAVSVYGFLYLKNIFPKLKSLSDKSVANFFAMSLLWQHLDEVNFFFRRQMQKYFRYFKSDDRLMMPSSNKWEYCIEWVAQNMKIVLENELVKNYLNRSYVDEIHDFHQTYTSAVAKAISKQKWISFLGKTFMKEHIKSLNCNMVFLQQLLPNDTYVNRILKMFNPTQRNFFQNVQDYRKSLMYYYTIFAEHHHRWNEPRFEANAATDSEMDIVLHYGILMPPVYFPGHERFINFILMAPIIIHEIGHNINFILGEISKASDSTKEAFFEKKHCIENQFSEYKFRILDENLNGTKYFDENLSDNLGFAFADKMIDELTSSDVFLLPGLPYTPKQLLYMSTRQLFCSKLARKMEMHFQTDEKHAPPEYRLIGSVQNSKRYSEAFNCTEGSYMNPIEKCALFDKI